MNEEHIEIVTALSNSTLLPGSFDKLLIRNWTAKMNNNIPMSDIGARHVYKLLYRYRSQCPETYEKYKDHPLCVAYGTVSV